MNAEQDPPSPGGTAEIARRMVERATELAASGRLARAAARYAEAAGVHAQAGRRSDRARCLVLAATAARLGGDLDAAEGYVDLARQSADRSDPVRLPLAAEAAEIALASGQPLAAVQALNEALDLGHMQDKDLRRDAELLHRRGMATAALGSIEPAAADLAESARLLVELGETRLAARVLVERATALHNAGAPATAQALIEARGAAAGDDTLSAEVELLAGARAVEAGQLDDAHDHAVAARDRALAAVAPVQYVGAVLALSRLADLVGDRPAAYGHLAAGWASLGDLLGAQTAEHVFRAHLEAAENAWGTEAFAAAKATYEAGRRAALAGEQPPAR